MERDPLVYLYAAFGLPNALDGIERRKFRILFQLPAFKDEDLNSSSRTTPERLLGLQDRLQ